MHSKMTRGEKAFNVANIILLTLLCLTMLYPYVHSLAMSLSDRWDVTRGSVILIPKGFNLQSYDYIFSNSLFWNALGLTVLITVVGTAFSVLMTCLLAYPMANRHFKLRNFLMVMVVITMFFSGGLIPTFLLYKALGLIDNFLVFIIPQAISTWSLIILVSFFRQIPEEIEEAAQLDGASEFKTLFRVIVPMSLPSIATITLWYIVGYWNTFSTSIYYTTSPSLRTLQVVLYSIQQDAGRILDQGTHTASMASMTSDSLQAAWIMCVTVPILVVYPFLQKYFVQGVTVGALKG